MISVRNVTLRRGVNVVLDGASVTFTPGEKIGLVGRNGAGKSSFFALLNGTLHEDGGEFSIPAAWKMGQVAQEMPETEQSATDFVIEGDTVLLDAQTILIGDARSIFDRLEHSAFPLPPDSNSLLARAAQLDTNYDVWALMTTPGVLASD